MRFTTESGSTYVVENMTIKRIPAPGPQHRLRRDEERLRIVDWVKPLVVGRRALLLVEPIMDPPPPEGMVKVATVRWTTKVVSIEE